MYAKRLKSDVVAPSVFPSLPDEKDRILFIIVTWPLPFANSYSRKSPLSWKNPGEMFKSPCKISWVYVIIKAFSTILRQGKK